MSKLKDFIAVLKTEGVAKNNRFAVEFALPIGMTGSPRSYYDSKLQHVLLFCDRASLPGMNMATAPNRAFGELRETPYEKIFDNVELSFYVDNSMVVKSLFDEWMNTIQDRNQRTFAYYKDYISNIRVTVFDNKDVPRYQVELFEAFPKLVSAISLDYNGREVMKLNVNFVYKYSMKTDFASPSQKDYISRLSNLGVEVDTKGNKIPDGYFTDFAGFQNTYTQFNESYENSRSALFNETQNFITGTGRRAGEISNQVKSKLGTIIG